MIIDLEPLNFLHSWLENRLVAYHTNYSKFHTMQNRLCTILGTSKKGLKFSYHLAHQIHLPHQIENAVYIYTDGSKQTGGLNIKFSFRLPNRTSCVREWAAPASSRALRMWVLQPCPHTRNNKQTDVCILQHSTVQQLSYCWPKTLTKCAQLKD